MKSDVLLEKSYVEAKIKLSKSISDAMTSKINEDALTKEIGEVSKCFSGNDLEEFLVQALWIQGLNIKGSCNPEEQESKFKLYASIVQGLIKVNIIKRSLVLERLDETSLVKCGLIEEEKIFKMKMNKITTKMFFEQEKFNLLREESEGFSKLIYLLFQTNFSAVELEEQLFTLIGYFDLDPNRVLSITIGLLFECEDAKRKVVISILGKLAGNERIYQILLTKLKSILNSGECSMPMKQNNSLASFYYLAAELLEAGYLSLAHIISYLNFKSENKSDIEQEKVSIQNRVNKYYNSFKGNRNLPFSEKVSLATSGKLPAGSDDPNELNEYSNSAAGPATSSFLNNYSFWKIYDVIGENKFDMAKVSQLTSNNQNNSTAPISASPCNQAGVYLLLRALLIKRRKLDFFVVFKEFEDTYDSLYSPELGQELCKLIFWLLAPLYNQISLKAKLKEIKQKNIITQSNQMDIDESLNDLNGVEQENIENISFNQISNQEELFTELPQLLAILRFGLAKDIKLLTILLRLYNKFFTTKYKKILIDLTKNVFLPALSLTDATAELVGEVWGILEIFSWKTRFEMYEYWLNTIYYSHSSLYLKHSLIVRDTSRWINTVNNDNTKSMGRNLGILTNSNPVAVLNQIIRSMVLYNNYFDSFLQSLSYSCQYLANDVISYVFAMIYSDECTERLSSCKTSKYFKKLAAITASFYKKNYWMDFSPLFLYITKRIKDSVLNCADVYFLREIVFTFGGIKIEEDMKMDQVMSFAGGEKLILESLEILKDIKQYKRCVNALVDFIFNYKNEDQSGLNSVKEIEESSIVNTSDTVQINNFALFFVFMLSSQRSATLFASHEISDTKHALCLFDEFHNVFLQFSYFLMLANSQAYDSNAQAKPKTLLKSIFGGDAPARVLLNFKLSPEIIFHIYRETLPSLNEIFETPDYFKQVNEFREVFEMYQSINYNQFQQDDELFSIDNAKLLSDLYKPHGIWKNISTEIYFLFFSLKLSDIYYPEYTYNQKIEALQANLSQIVSQDAMSNDNQEAKNKKQADKVKVNITLLKEEKQACYQHVEKIKEVFSKLKDRLLGEISKENKKDISKYLIQYMFFPRLIFSKLDAIYTAKFIYLLVKSHVLNINVLDFIQKMLKILIPSLLSLSYYEATNLGIFLNEFFNQIFTWQHDSTWEAECANNSCFIRNFENHTQIKLFDFKDAIKFVLIKLIENFKNFLLLEEYTSCLNTLIILNSIFDIFPSTKESALDLEKTVVKVKEKMKEDDLAFRLGRYLDNLKVKIAAFSEETVSDELKKKENPKKEEAAKDKDKSKKDKASTVKDDNQKKKSKVTTSKEGSDTPEMKKKDSLEPEVESRKKK